MADGELERQLEQLVADNDRLRKDRDDHKALLEHCRNWSYSKAQIYQVLSYLSWHERKGKDASVGYRVLYLLGFERCPECHDEVGGIDCLYCNGLGWVRTCEERKKDE